MTTTGLYYKHVTIVNDDSCIINNWSFKLIDNAGVAIYDHNRFIIHATGLYCGTFTGLHSKGRLQLD